MLAEKGDRHRGGSVHHRQVPADPGRYPASPTTSMVSPHPGRNPASTTASKCSLLRSNLSFTSSSLSLSPLSLSLSISLSLSLSSLSLSLSLFSRFCSFDPCAWEDYPFLPHLPRNTSPLCPLSLCNKPPSPSSPALTLLHREVKAQRRDSEKTEDATPFPPEKSASGIVEYLLEAPPPSQSDTNAGNDEVLGAVVGVVMVTVALLLVGLVLAVNLRRLRPAALNGSTCTTNSCLAYQQMLTESVDRGAPACDNFYAHACGRWTKSHNRSVQDIAWENFSIAAAMTLQTSVRITRHITLKRQNFFKACLSVVDASNALGVKEVLAEGDIFWPQQNAKPDFLNALFYVSRSLLLPVFFSVEFRRHKSVLVFDANNYSRETLTRLLAKVGRRTIRQHLRITYEAFGAVNESRLADIVDAFHKGQNLLYEYSNSSLALSDADQTKAFNTSDSSSLLLLAPSVSKVRWDTVLRRYLNITFEEIRGLVVNVPQNFRAVFNLHKEISEATMNDFVETLCVQILVRYINHKVLKSFYGNPETAIKALRKDCFTSTFTFFGYDVNHLLLDATFGAREKMIKLGDYVRASFLGVLRPNNTTAPTKLSDSRYNSTKSFRHVFEVLEMSHPNTYPALYDYYPDMGSNPLRNRKRIIEFYGTLQAEDISVLGRNTGKYLFRFSGFTILVPHLELPFFAQDAHRGTVLGGLGARMAAAVFYDFVESHTEFEEIYQRNQDCLSPGTGDKPDLDIQGAVAAVPLVWAMFEKASEVTDDVLVMDLPTFKAAYVPFLSACYFLCGALDGERLCNVPLKHSVDFARVKAQRLFFFNYPAILLQTRES
ncbi:hypothetical protein HPB48_007780 [Haemaphysalis longicornis]|uniref:Peptidase M13 N-terminal domain-containing protein n=1 Tax=Haemaphysalis longicornis TaxID=44386 RepID=A0A9J6GBB0_HAELO|nr:hypothetical protein HPB48_007780 [Haemaphysalis longicornis]